MTSLQAFTAGELEEMGSDARCELIEGVLYETSPSNTDSSAIVIRLAIKLGAFVYEHRLGILTGEAGGYHLERDPDSVVAPDLAFIRSDRYANRPSGSSLFPGIPDLAVEVLSPGNAVADIRRKQALYQRVGIPLTWWIDPRRRTVIVHSPERSPRLLNETDSLDGEDIIPGFSMPLAKLFDIPGQL